MDSDYKPPREWLCDKDNENSNQTNPCEIKIRYKNQYLHIVFSQISMRGRLTPYVIPGNWGYFLICTYIVNESLGVAV